MTDIFYRLCKTSDPEERLEDAVMWKALHDTFGDAITLLADDDKAPDHGVFLGRTRMSEMSAPVFRPPHQSYWTDPAFTSRCARRMEVTDLDGARALVDEIHASGRDAFVKSTKQKHFTGSVPQGQSLVEALDAMIYSFIDRPACLLVQEHVDMRYERRFLVIDGEVVTQSPVAWHLTPMSRSWMRDDAMGLDLEDMHFETPRDTTARYAPDATRRMTEAAREMAAAAETPHLCIDLCLTGPDIETAEIEPVEWNPMQPGMVGLYGCDPMPLARAVRRVLVPEVDREPDAEVMEV